MQKLLKTSLMIVLLFIFGVSLSAQDKQVSTEKTVPVFKDGEAQVVEGFKDAKKWIRAELWVETTFDTDGDGKLDRMHVDVVRPYQTETEGLKLPVIYESSPYFAGTAGTDKKYFWNTRQELGDVPVTRPHPPEIKWSANRPIISNSQVSTWVPRGFIVVHSESPGTGLSDGSPTVGGENESLAPKAVIDWLNGRANGYTTRDGNEKVMACWTTGKVGMTGTSYNGTLPLAAATTGVDGLMAIIPDAPNTSYYHYYRSNGLIRSPGGYLGEDVDVLYDFIHSGNVEKRVYGNSVVRDKEMAEGMDRIKGDYNDFWAGRDYINHLKPVKAAVFLSQGLSDWNVMPEHSIRIYEALKAQGVPAMIYLHQGGHGGPPPLPMMNRWFTRYLFGIENGVEKDPRAWIVRENGQREKPTSYADYPNPAAAPVKLFLTAGGVEQGGLVTSPASGQGKETLVDNFSFSGNTLAQAENTNHRLIYAGPVLTAPVHISGTVKVTVKLASSKPAANLSVYLLALPWTESRTPKITDNLITRGWADPQNYKSLRESEPLVPGKFYEMTFNLQPDDQVVPAGKQIALMIFSSDRDFTLSPKPGTELTIDLDGTSITLPIVGGAEGYSKAINK
jgi:X-Pro dipeptidyl-peptidase